MIHFRKGKEEHIVPESERAHYESDGWSMIEEGVGTPKRPNAKRVDGKWQRDAEDEAKDRWRDAAPEDNFQALKDEIEALRQRLDKLEASQKG
jgi:polyhydroxyalkanoate synthesis regulator phasin